MVKEYFWNFDIDIVLMCCRWREEQRWSSFEWEKEQWDCSRPKVKNNLSIQPLGGELVKAHIKGFKIWNAGLQKKFSTLLFIREKRNKRVTEQFLPQVRPTRPWRKAVPDISSLPMLIISHIRSQVALYFPKIIFICQTAGDWQSADSVETLRSHQNTNKLSSHSCQCVDQFNNF